MAQFKITGDVPGKGFRHDGRVYHTGDIVDLPDSFPVSMFSYLSPVMLDLSQFRRESPAPVKPILAIMSVRSIPEVQTAFKKLNFVDKVWFRNFTPAVISDKINDWLDAHGSKYTHVIVSSDDVDPEPEDIRQLVEDAKFYDLPVIAGFCNICFFDRQDENGMICGCCVDGRLHEFVNVTIEPVDTVHIRRNGYNFVRKEWAINHPGIRPVWFQGMACGMVSLDVWRRIPFRSWDNGEGGLMQDLAFAYDCAKAGITQFVDFRVRMRHYGTHHGKLFVGKKPTHIDFEKAKKR